jgi:hypothetical protein
MLALSTRTVTTSEATRTLVIAAWPTSRRCRQVTYATTTAASVAKAITTTTALSGAGCPSRVRRAGLSSAKSPPPKIVAAAK